MPDYDFRQLSNDDLRKILAARQEGAGYIAWQAASALLFRRVDTSVGSQDDSGFVKELSDPDIEKIKSIVNK